MKQNLFNIGTLLILSSVYSSANAAIPINLSSQPANFLQATLTSPTAVSGIKIKEISRDQDFNQTLHIRIKQEYQGYPVWGGDGIVHVPHAASSKMPLTIMVSKNTTLNGIMYANINNDLVNTPSYVFNKPQADAAMKQAITLYQKSIGAQPDIQHKKIQMMVYIDQNNKAHWAFYITFYASPIEVNGMPSKPVYIIDALTFNIYKTWNDIKTEQLENVDGGGFGGNLKTGKVFYDSLPNHLSKFTIQRDSISKMCFLKNEDLIVKDERTQKQIEFSCASKNHRYNDLYWNDLDDQTNGGYSPNNDAIFSITRIKEMYEKWYGIFPVMEDDGKSASISVYTHVRMQNAYWEGYVDGEWRIKLGDGGSLMYPFTSPGVIAHELGHGFTEQHSGLVYAEQSGGLNESFSDMADQAAQFYALGKNSWLHDAEIMKAEGKALRYLDDPTKDCKNGAIPGDSCSINHMKQYKDTTDVHYSSGLFNHVFYLIGTAKDWDTKKAFDVMVKANMHYWTPNTTFADAACGVIKATQDYHYNVDAVLNAFIQVGVDTSQCFS